MIRQRRACVPAIPIVGTLVPILGGMAGSPATTLDR